MLLFNNKFSDGTIPKKVKYLTGVVLIILLIAHVALHYVSDYPFEEKHPAMTNLAKLVEEEVGLTEIRFSSFTYAVSADVNKINLFYLASSSLDFSLYHNGRIVWHMLWHYYCEN